MRSEFEAWISNLSRGCADLHVNIYGDYDDPQVIPYWQAWQASRAAIEINIPDIYDNKYTPSSVTMDGFHFEEYLDDLQNTILAAGLRVKEQK